MSRKLRIAAEVTAILLAIALSLFLVNAFLGPLIELAWPAALAIFVVGFSRKRDDRSTEEGRRNRLFGSVALLASAGLLATAGLIGVVQDHVWLAISQLIGAVVVVMVSRSKVFDQSAPRGA